RLTDENFGELQKNVSDLRRSFFDPDQVMSISEETYQQFAHLLARLINKVQIYLTDGNMYTKAYSHNFFRMSRSFLKRSEQFRRLFRNGVPTSDDNHTLAYEATLLRRKNEFIMSTGGQQSFSSLKLKYSNIFALYLRQCLNLHSTMNVHGIFDNINLLMVRISEQPIILDDQERESLELSLKKFDIPLICPPILCRRVSNLKQNESDSILPLQTIDVSEKEKDTDVTFIDLLKSITGEHWIVLIGGPGSGKTTIARWLTCELSRNILNEQKNMVINNIDMGPTRIPILIRIGEFAEWLENHSSSNLFDYIGHNTWMTQNYINSEFEILQDFVRHGHAFIILDGLDEVTTFEMYTQINNQIHDFMDTYCMSNDFESPFDNECMATASLGCPFRCENLTKGNIVILTSRIINYTAKPLQSNLISHYMIQPMNIEYLSNTIKQWCYHVQDEIIPLLIRYIPEIKKQQTKYKSIFDSKILIKRIESDKGVQSFASNLSVLSIICTLFTQYGIDVLKKPRVQLYQQVVESMVQRWQNRRSIIPKDALISIFSEMAFYIHSRSGAGLIDELDLTHLCRLSLRRWYTQYSDNTNYNSTNIRQQTQQFMQFISEDAGIIAARALCVYGFLHLTFQEYFVCLALVNVDHCNQIEAINELVNRFMSLGSNFRLREPLNLALGWISLHWSFENFDYFCIQLQSNTNLTNKHLPMGSLLFISAIDDLGCLPSVSTIYSILNSLLEFEIDKTECVFERRLLSGLDRLPIDNVTNWFNHVFMKGNTTLSLKLLNILYWPVLNSPPLPQWVTTQLCEVLWKQFGRYNHEIDTCIDRILMIISAINHHCLPSPPNNLRAYLLSKTIRTQELHSSVLAALIILYGGLEYEDRKTSPLLVFKACRMYRDSPLSHLLIDYFNDTATNQTVKLQNLIDQCQNIVDRAVSTNVTLEAIHSLIVLFCFYGINNSSIYEKYIGSQLWQSAVSHMKIVHYYLRQFYFVDPRSRFKKNLLDSFEDFIIDSEDILDFIQSMSHAYTNLLRSRTSFLSQKRFLSEEIALLNIKIPSTIQLTNIADWNEDTIVRRLAFVCYISLSRYVIETEELEAGDIHLLKLGTHPLQLLQNKPITLLLAYVPVSVQHLYMELFAQKQLCMNETSPLPFFHLLIESLYGLLMIDWPCIRLCVLISILSPIISQYRMENFVRFTNTKSSLDRSPWRFIKALENDFSRSFTNYILIVEDYDDEKNERRIAANEEQRRIDNAQNDFELYAACCCLAKVTRRYEYSMSSEERLERLWIFVQTIKQPIWRVDAAINIFCLMLPDDVNFKPLEDCFKKCFLRLISWLEEIEPITPLLTYVALVVRCMSVIRDENFPLKKGFICNILQRLQTIKINEQSAICEALVTIPAFRSDVCQYIRHLQSSGSMLAFNQIFPSNSKLFSKYFCMKYFRTSDMGNVRLMLLTSMYLYEMTSYVRFLDNSVIKKTVECHIEQEPVPASFVEKCLMALEKEPTCSLNVEVASNISKLLSSSITEAEKMEVSRLQYALVKKENATESACTFVLEWLNYRDDTILNTFAYYGAILLASSKFWTTTILEICCQLMNNENDHLRTRAIKLIKNHEWNMEKDCANKILDYLYHWNEKEMKIISDIEYLLSTLVINTIDQMKNVLKFERDRFNHFHQKTSKYEISFFQLIKELSIEARDYVIDLMVSLSNSSSDLSFLQWILEYLPGDVLASDQRFAEFLERLLRDCHDKKLKIIIGKNLLHFPNNEQLENILWTTITNNEQENSDEFIATCIFSLYIDDEHQNEIFVREKLEYLDRLRQQSSSLLIRQAVLAKLYFYVENKPETYDIIEVYYSYMISTSDRLTSNYEISTKIAARWISEHASTLLPLFIEDMYKNFDHESFFGNLNYMRVAELLCQDIPADFRNVVRQSSFGEVAFRKSVYETSKKVSLLTQEQCIMVYACFEDVSIHLIEMIMQATLESLRKLDISDFIKSVRIVSGRQSIESLFNILTSTKSLKQRYAAAALLIYLASLNYVSTIEVEEHLNAAIEDPWSQQVFDKDNEKTRADYSLKRLLLTLLVKEIHSGGIRSFTNDDLINEAAEYRIPAAIFDKING
ncbi:unnamed protein product, partial [Rotaria sp. Silwood2]